MDIVEKEFKTIAVLYDKMYLYKPDDAIRVIRRCKELNRQIYGLDAFILSANKIQPYMTHSIDYSKGFLESPLPSGNWNEAVDFLTKYLDDMFLFEVNYDGYGDD